MNLEEGHCAARQRPWWFERVFILSEAHSTSRRSNKSTVRREIWLTLLGLRLSPLVPAPLVNFFAAVFVCLAPSVPDDQFWAARHSSCFIGK